MLEAEYPAQTKYRYVQKWFKRLGAHGPGVKHVVVNPRMGSAAAKANQMRQGEWIPVLPGTDVYFVLGMIRWIIENGTFKKDFLSRPNEKAAKAGGYRLHTDLSYLVGTQEPKVFLTGDKAGLKKSPHVVSVNGKLAPADQADGPADLDVSAVVDGIEYKTVFRMIRERVQDKTLEECEEVCDIPPGTIARIAREFSTAKTPAAEFFRGVVQNPNGWGNGRAVILLNLLVGNIDRKGGYTRGHEWYAGSIGKAEPVKASGVPIDRHLVSYQGKKPTATRPWYPWVIRDTAPEAWPSMKIGYPYRIKALINFYNDPAYTFPFNQPMMNEVMKDLKAIPLFIAITAFMGETDMYADYILPDTSYLERWGTYTSYPTVLTRMAPLRQPVVGTFDPKTREYRGIHPDTRTAEDILIMLGKKLGLPNVGKNGMGPGKDLDTAYDYWNEYFTSGELKDSGGLKPGSSVVALGGVFENPGLKYDTDGYIHYGGMKIPPFINFYHNGVASTKNAMTGKYFDALPQYRFMIDCTEQPIAVDRKEYPFQIITWKDAFHTQSRTAQNLWLVSLKPENPMWINPVDAAKVGVASGDWVKVKSPTSKPSEVHTNHAGDGWYKFKVKVTSRVRPGVVAVCHSYGRWAGGSRPWYVDGKAQYSDERIGAGWQMNPLVLADPVLKDIVVMDPIGGGTMFFGTPVKIEKV